MWSVQITKAIIVTFAIFSPTIQTQQHIVALHSPSISTPCILNGLLAKNIDGELVTKFCTSVDPATDPSKVGSKYMKPSTSKSKTNPTSKSSKLVRRLPLSKIRTTNAPTGTRTELFIPQIPPVIYTDTTDDTYPSLHYLTVNGKTTRQYFLVAPDSYDSTKPLPILVGLHGINGSPAAFRDQFLFGALASEYNYVGIFPLGWGDEVNSSPTWNAGSCCLSAVVANINDTEFVQAIIQEVKKNYLIDESRIWAIGFSAGGMMAYKLGCDLSSVFTAVGIVSGSMMQDPCNPAAPISIFHLHGELDDVIPVLGGGQYSTPPILAGVLTAAGIFGCTPTQDGPDEFNLKETSAWNCDYETEIRLNIYKGIEHEFLRSWAYELVDFLMLHPRIKYKASS